MTLNLTLENDAYWISNDDKRLGPFPTLQTVESANICEQLRCTPSEFLAAKMRYLENTDPRTLVREALANLKETFNHWLYLEDDPEILDIVLAAACDRLLPGDPVWVLLISPSGGTKTELVETLRSSGLTYTLDSLTKATLVSGKRIRLKSGEWVPAGGIFKELDGKVLVIKDFTIVLTKYEDERRQIFSQLRGMYDGRLEYGFGEGKPIRVEARCGLIAACTPAIDHYTSLYVTLGERFLKVRHRPKDPAVAQRALKNQGTEDQMRTELREQTAAYISHIAGRIRDYTLTEQVEAWLVNLARATALLRTPVMMRTWRGEVEELVTPSVEFATRLVKQLAKMLKLIANIRGHEKIQPEDQETLRRIACDTILPNRAKIIPVLTVKGDHTTRGIAAKAGIPRSTCWRELMELEALNIVTRNRYELQSEYGHVQRDPDLDGWVLIHEDPDLNILLSQLSSLTRVEREERVEASGGGTLGQDCPHCHSPVEPGAGSVKDGDETWHTVCFNEKVKEMVQ